MLIGTNVVPSVEDKPHQMGTLFLSRMTLELYVAMVYIVYPAMFA